MTREELHRKVEVILREPPESYTEWANELIAVVLEAAAKVAEREGVYPELNIANGGPDWYRHGRNIAAAIRALIRTASC